MLTCPKCNYYNSDFADRCEQCGTRLSATNTERSRGRDAPAAVVGNRPATATAACPNCGAAAFTRLCPECGYQLRGEPAYAGFWVRGLAMFIDAIVLGTVSIFTQVFMPWAAGLGFLVLTAVYEIALEAKTGATFGKKALSLRVTTPNLDDISLGRSAARHFAHYLSAIFLIGYLMPVFNRRKRALHDYIAGTVVIKDRR